MKKEKTEISEDTRIYEVGYHLVSMLPEEKLPEAVALIKSSIEAKGGVFVSEDFPKMKVLAYPISRATAGKREHFTHAHFGWMKFELSQVELASVKEVLDNDKNIIRFVIVKTVAENTLATIRPAFVKKGDGEEKKDILKQEISQEELDKSIEKLVGDVSLKI